MHLVLHVLHLSIIQDFKLQHNLRICDSRAIRMPNAAVCARGGAGEGGG